MKRTLVFSLLLAALGTGCATGRTARPDEPARGDRRGGGPVEVGIASYYADVLEGRLTANGERFRQAAATCAHRRHPFGTVLEVEVIDSGRSAICRVNDRGPFVQGRIVDVSKRVARELDLVERGLAKVRVRKVER